MDNDVGQQLDLLFRPAFGLGLFLGGPDALCNRAVQHSRKVMSKDPVDGILNPPVAVHDLQQGPSIRGLVGNVVAGLRAGLVPLPSLGLDQDQVAQVGPSPVGIHIPNVRRCADDPAAACLDATLVLVHGLVKVLVAALGCSTAKVSITASCNCGWLPLSAST